jgi:hypothetical protein
MNKRKTPSVSYSSFSRPLVHRLMARGGYLPELTQPRFMGGGWAKAKAFFRKLFS